MFICSIRRLLQRNRRIEEDNSPEKARIDKNGFKIWSKSSFQLFMQGHETDLKFCKSWSGDCAALSPSPTLFSVYRRNLTIHFHLSPC